MAQSYLILLYLYLEKKIKILYSLDCQQVYFWEKLEKRTIWFITSFIILGLILCSIVGKTSSNTEEKYWLAPLKLIVVSFYYTTKKHLLPEYQSFEGKNVWWNIFLIKYCKLAIIVKFAPDILMLHDSKLL